jgi:hypothetical protein
MAEEPAAFISRIRERVRALAEARPGDVELQGLYLEFVHHDTTTSMGPVLTVEIESDAPVLKGSFLLDFMEQVRKQQRVYANEMNELTARALRNSNWRVVPWDGVFIDFRIMEDNMLHAYSFEQILKRVEAGERKQFAHEFRAIVVKYNAYINDTAVPWFKKVVSGSIDWAKLWGLQWNRPNNIYFIQHLVTEHSGSHPAPPFQVIVIGSNKFYVADDDLACTKDIRIDIDPGLLSVITL